jgi:hypothetical protein
MFPRRPTEQEEVNKKKKKVQKRMLRWKARHPLKRRKGHVSL